MYAQLPVAVIGAGPVGLAAVAHLLDRGLPAVSLEAGEEAGAAVSRWRHVRMFSAWRYNIDPVCARLLRAAGRPVPETDDYPTGGDLLEHYLKPLAALPEVAACAHYRTCAAAVTRLDHDKLRRDERSRAPF